MNYPVWDVAFGSGLLVAIVSIVHVFVSHFAVGGGLFLVLTELKAYRENDPALLDWLKSHTKFFVLVTVVFGAISGVGIWFTIGLVHPSATSTLIHSYVWGWAIEWVFFFIEITAALLYLYGWNRLDRRTHLWYGWIYFIAAYASLVVINGIITFMLTTGGWLENRDFWTGFFNPTYFPSLVLRTALALALAGVYALLTGVLRRDPELRGKIVRWSARWILPAFVVMPFVAFWYVRSIPADLWDSARAGAPTAGRYATLLVAFSAATFLLALATLVRPRRTPFALALLVFAGAFGTMWSFEFIREAVRKPYVIAGYMYGNALYALPEGDGRFTVEHLEEHGVLRTARWVEHRDLDSVEPAAAGREIFRVECQACHTPEAYRGVKGYLEERVWDRDTVFEMLKGLDAMHEGVMPPFAGTEGERAALADYLAALHPVGSVEATPGGGEAAFERWCGACHRPRADDSAFAMLGDMDGETMVEMFEDLTVLNEKMPALDMPEADKQALADWVAARSAAD